MPCPITETLGPRAAELSDELVLKLDRLCTGVTVHRKVAIGFSGGVDSTFLAWCSKAVLGAENTILVTAESETYPEFERRDSRELAAQLGLTQIVISTRELELPEYRSNPSNRCYYCKKTLFQEVGRVAVDQGCDALFEGGNADDLLDYRPGRKALSELKIESPLAGAGLTKNDIRLVSRLAGIPTASKASYACLASRFPYGEEITAAKLRRVELAEDGLRRLGFSQFRVRSHGDLARVELVPGELTRGWETRDEIDRVCREAGFVYACLDFRGYRMGAMNEQLKSSQKEDAS